MSIRLHSIEFARESDTARCGKPAVAECADCGASICSDCRTECCGQAFCDLCYEYHLKNRCLRKQRYFWTIRMFPLYGYVPSVKPCFLLSVLENLTYRSYSKLMRSSAFIASRNTQAHR